MRIQSISRTNPEPYTTKMRNTILLLSTIILAAALIFPSSSYALLGHLSTHARDLLPGVLFYAWVGLYIFIAWFLAVTGQFWILDVFRGRICGNKFMDCRPWD